MFNFVESISKVVGGNFKFISKYEAIMLVKDTREEFIHQMITIWIILALLATSLAFIVLKADFPLIIYLNLMISIIVIVKSKNITQFGINTLPVKQLMKFSVLNLISILFIYLLIEPWSHIYDKLLELSLERSVDITFGWINYYPRVVALLIILLFGGFVTIFSEEFLFRGILEGYLLKNFSPSLAILLQSLLFSIPQSLLLFVFSFVDGLIYIVFYSIITIGIINGLTVYKCRSIFPSVIAASFANFIMALFLF